MAADTTETSEIKGVSGRSYTRVKTGISKLFPIKPLRAGVSFWGSGQILVDVAANDSPHMPTDVWLEDFIALNEASPTIEAFANSLQREINVRVGVEAPRLGFQLAGVEQLDSNAHQPVFYRVANHDESGGLRGQFEIERKRPSNLSGPPHLFADGDRSVFIDLYERVRLGGPIETSLNHPIPQDSLRGRAEYLAAWVRFVSDLYRGAGLIRTIGGAVTVLSVGLAGEFDYANS